jgi:hypothetical protein
MESVFQHNCSIFDILLKPDFAHWMANYHFAIDKINTHSNTGLHLFKRFALNIIKQIIHDSDNNVLVICLLVSCTVNNWLGKLFNPIEQLTGTFRLPMSSIVAKVKIKQSTVRGIPKFPIKLKNI